MASAGLDVKHETLIGQKVKLVPFTTQHDWDYLSALSLSYKYNIFPGSTAQEHYEKYGKIFWKVYIDDGLKCGVIVLSHYPDRDMWTFSAFADLEAVKQVPDRAKTDYIIEAGELAIKYFFNGIDRVLYLFHDVRNRSVARLAERLGFNFCEEGITGGLTYNMMIRRP